MVKVFKKLESTRKRLEMVDIVSSFLKTVPVDHIENVVLLLMGKVFPEYSEYEVGMASQMIIKTISKATGIREEEINKMWVDKGDLGDVCEEALKKRKQATLFERKGLTVEKLVSNLEKIAKLTGKGTTEKKIMLTAEILSSATPEEANYVVKLLLGKLRVGVGEGVVRDAIAKAFNIDTKDVEKAWQLRPNYGYIAKMAKQGKIKQIKIELGKPIQVLLAEKAPNLEYAIKKAGNPGMEYKYDGMRAQIHKDDSNVWIFTRRLENVTKQFPDLVKLVREHVKCKKCIIEGEVLAVKNGKPLPFQTLSQRIKRKYNIKEMVKKIPIKIELFDIVYLDGKTLFNTVLEKRRSLLDSIVQQSKDIKLSKMIRTKDIKEAEEFYNQALKDGQEGVMVKNLDSKYVAGRKEGYWWKVKPVMESLDLTITRAEWGEGKRKGFLSSFVLACRDEYTGEFLECGMVGTGIKEKEGITFKSMTELLKPHIIEQHGKTVVIRPSIVVEVSYQEIQKSPKYSSGYALRFPRFVRIRDDKSPDEVDTLERIERLYKNQKHRKG